MKPESTLDASQCTPASMGCPIPDASQCTPASEAEGQAMSESTSTKCFFSTRQLLLQHIHDHGWRIQKQDCPRIYFSCSKCSLKFKAKAQDSDYENGAWCALNMPSEHECSKCTHKPVATAMTTRVCQLPSKVYKDIQRLACCKAFLTTNIQSYIQHTYNGLLVDTHLIYNIGYRARQKLGISEMDKLYEQQAVTLYTSPSFCILIKVAGTTSARRHVRTCVSCGT